VSFPIKTPCVNLELAVEGSPMSLGECLRRKGHENGFNTIRLFAATLVLFSHAFPITTGSNQHEPIFACSRGQATLGSLAVGAFFVISGFLISNSFERSSTFKNFLRKRTLRIMPALVASCVLLGCFVGPLLTNLSLPAYFQHPELWSFMGNMVFLPDPYILPGVFRDRILPAANGSLWTLKFEVACYLAAAAFLWFGRRKFILVLLSWLSAMVLARVMDTGGGIQYYVAYGAYLFRFFGSGMLMYLLRDRVPVRWDLAVGALILTMGSIATPLFMEVAATFGAYALLVFGYKCAPSFRALTAKGDISYGVYIYAWPIQQLVAPLCAGMSAPWLWNIALALPITLVAGCVSWMLIEKPAIELKRQSAK
jgi:peptidoglycan/LPS O-acetylase OafA/YrhL